STGVFEHTVRQIEGGDPKTRAGAGCRMLAERPPLYQPSFCTAGQEQAFPGDCVEQWRTSLQHDLSQLDSPARRRQLGREMQSDLVVTARGAHRGKRRVDRRACVDYKHVDAVQELRQLREARVV